MPISRSHVEAIAAPSAWLIMRLILPRLMPALDDNSQPHYLGAPGRGWPPNSGGRRLPRTARPSVRRAHAAASGLPWRLGPVKCSQEVSPWPGRYRHFVVIGGGGSSARVDFASHPARADGTMRRLSGGFAAKHRRRVSDMTSLGIVGGLAIGGC